MLHKHTKFDNICSSEDIYRSNIHRHFEPSLWPWLCSNPVFPQNTLAYDAVLSNQIWLQIYQQFRRNSRNSHILIIYALAVTLTLKTVNQFFCMTLWLMMMHKHTKFSIIQINIHLYTFTYILNLCWTLWLLMLYYRHAGPDFINLIFIPLSPCTKSNPANTLCVALFSARSINDPLKAAEISIFISYNQVDILIFDQVLALSTRRWGKV